MKHCFRFLASFSKEEEIFFWTLEQSECLHLSQVLRLKPGDQIEVFDGKGHYALATIETVQGKTLAIAVSSDIQKEIPSEKKKAIAIASLKKQTMEDLLPSLVELGLSEIHIFSQEKTEKYLFSEKIIDRYEKIILSACKQAKRNFLPELNFWRDKKDLGLFLQKNYEKLFLLSPHGRRFDLSKDFEFQTICHIIGSEAGLSAEEESFFLTLGASERSLGSFVLRAYTAAIAASSLFL